MKSVVFAGELAGAVGESAQAHAAALGWLAPAHSCHHFPHWYLHWCVFLLQIGPWLARYFCPHATHGLHFNDKMRPSDTCFNDKPFWWLCIGAVTNITDAICKREQFANNIFCESTSKFKSLITGVLPPLLLTLWQNLFLPQLIYLGAQVLIALLKLLFVGPVSIGHTLYMVTPVEVVVHLSSHLMGMHMQSLLLSCLLAFRFETARPIPVQPQPSRP